MNSVQFVIDRTQASYDVAVLIAGAWTWSEAAPPQMLAELTSIRAKVNEVSAADVDRIDAREVLDAELETYRRGTRQFVRMAKVKHRTSRVKTGHLRRVKLTSRGRQHALDVGRRAEDVWLKIDGTWNPTGELTLAAYQSCGANCQVYLNQYSAKSRVWEDKVAELQAQAATLDGLMVAWYGMATAVFGPDTPEGDLIRRAVPTSPGDVAAVQAAVFTLAESPAAGAVHLEFTAEHATSFQVWHKGPGAAQFVLAEPVVTGSYLKAGLPAGGHEYQIVGVNSRGEGPASEVAHITVAQAQAA